MPVSTPIATAPEHATRQMMWMKDCSGDGSIDTENGMTVMIAVMID